MIKIPPLPSDITASAIRILFVVLVAIALLAGTYIKGRTDGHDLAENDYLQEKVKWQSTIIQSQGELQQSINVTLDKYLKDAVVYRTVIKTIKQDPQVIKIYVPAAADAACQINKGFVELHNKAIDGVPVEALNVASPNVGDPAESKLSDVAGTVAENYYSCNEVRKRLAGLQEVVRKYQKKQKELSK